MLIYAVDDEPLALRSLSRAILEAQPNCRLREFTWAQPMLDLMDEQGERPDAVFMDVEMPGFNGVEAARRMKLLSPHTWIVFVTGFSEYALDAFSVHARGYIVKPVTAQAVRAELAEEAAVLPPLPPSERPCLRVRTFGNFEAYIGDEPLEFSRSKSKEMLAYLIHRGGASCSTQELAAVLFEDQADGRLDYFFKIAQCLKHTLNNAGCGSVLRHSYKTYAVDPAQVDCDYYRFLTDSDALNAYAGEYMAQYSWAEITNAYLNDQK